MKVLMTTDCVGGVWTYALHLARQLTADGHQIVLAVMGGDLAPDQDAQLAGAGLAGFAARPYRLEWMAQPEDDLGAAGAWLLDLAAEHHPDVVHLNQFSHAALAWPCPALVVAHSDVVTWWRAVHGDDPDAPWDGYRERVTAGLRAAHLVVSPTAALLDQLRLAYAFDTPARVVHNATAVAAAQRPKRQQMVAAGRVWDEAKNIAGAARAAEGLSWPLVVAGAGEVEGARCLGRLSAAELADLLAESSIFVAPARYEPFGLTALEAGRAGCALVLGDIATLREVWGDAATYVPPADEVALRAALQDLIADADLLAERARAASARAGCFGMPAMAAAYTDCYREVVSTSLRRDRAAS